MGKGGRVQPVTPPTFPAHVLESVLAERPVAELKKLAAQRGLKSEGTHDELLAQLHPYAKVSGDVVVFRAMVCTSSAAEKHYDSRTIVLFCGASLFLFLFAPMFVQPP